MRTLSHIPKSQKVYPPSQDKFQTSNPDGKMLCRGQRAVQYIGLRAWRLRSISKSEEFHS